MGQGVTDKQIAQLQLGMYGQIPGIRWDYLTKLSDRVVWGAKKADDGVTDIVFRGTTDLQSLLMDLHALRSQNVPTLGRVHPGFYDSMEWVWQAVQANTEPPWRFSGHSLGAAHAAILTGQAVRDGKPPVYLVGWGPPKAGFAELAKLIEHIPCRLYRNEAHPNSRHQDPIPDFPSFLPGYEYVHVAPIISICQPPVGKSEFDLFAWHAMALYAEGTTT